MSTLTRSDGNEFVIQAYRELIKDDSKSAIAQKVKQLAEQHGRFVRLFRKSHLVYEAVFSNSAGYLLGESVKHYFYQAQNLIFCEAMDDKKNVLTVVVRDGEVYMDAIIPTTSLYSELQLLIGDEYQYRVFTHGNVPLKESNDGDNENPENFTLPTKKVTHFEKISDPLFHRLPTLKNLQLLPLPLALKNQHLNGNAKTITYTAICIIAAAFGWLILITTNKLQQRGPTKITTHPYAAFQASFHSASAHRQLLNMSSTVEALLTLPGWSANRVNYTNQRYRISLQNNGGTLSDLRLWCQHNGYRLRLEQTQPVIVKQINLPVDHINTTLQNTEQATASLADKLHPLLGENSVVIGNTQAVANDKKTPITVHLNNVTPEVFTIISDFIQSEPITLQHAEFNIHNITLSGTLELNLWGN